MTREFKIVDSRRSGPRAGLGYFFHVSNSGQIWIKICEFFDNHIVHFIQTQFSEQKQKFSEGCIHSIDS